MKIGAKGEVFGGLAMREEVPLSYQAEPVEGDILDFLLLQLWSPDCKIFEFAEKHPPWTQTSGSSPVCLSLSFPGSSFPRVS